MAGAATGGALVEDRHRGAARGQPPGDTQADHAGADDGDVRRLGTACGLVRQPVAPFAGMTQTEVHHASIIKGLDCQTRPWARIGAKGFFGTLSNRPAPLPYPLPR